MLSNSQPAMQIEVTTDPINQLKKSSAEQSFKPSSSSTMAAVSLSFREIWDDPSRKTSQCPLQVLLVQLRLIRTQKMNKPPYGLQQIRTNH